MHFICINSIAGWSSSNGCWKVFLKKTIVAHLFQIGDFVIWMEYFIRSLKTSEFKRRTSYSDVLLKLELEIMASMWRGHHGRKAPPASRTAARCSYSATVHWKFSWIFFTAVFLLFCLRNILEIFKVLPCLKGWAAILVVHESEYL